MMHLLTAGLALACLSRFATAARNERTFAVLHFNDHEIVRCREDPIISPGQVSGHVHSVFGGSAFSRNVTGEELLQSTCSNAKVKGDFSNYWFPSLYYHDIQNNTFESVPLFYTNVYYFFEPTSDPVVPFPVGLQMVVGNPSLRTPPASRGNLNQDPTQGPINSIQCTCPRPNPNPPSWPAGSDGSMAGIQDTNNLDAGTGFPFHECDAFASPMRWDAHFPSCYNPAAGLTDYKNNMVFPSPVPGTPWANCPPGWIHTPHLFFEVYWNTLLFQDRWDHNGTWQPFVFSMGDCTGFGSHADALMAWDQPLLQNIIDNCNAGDSGMENCPGLKGLNTEKCTTTCSVDEQVDGVFTALPGNNPLSGWYCGKPPPAPAAAAPVSPAASAPAVAAPAPVAAAPAAPAAPSPASSSSTTTSSSASTSTPSSSEASSSSTTSSSEASSSPATSSTSFSVPLAAPSPVSPPSPPNFKEANDNSPASADPNVNVASSTSATTAEPTTTTTSFSTSATTTTTFVTVHPSSAPLCPTITAITVTDFMTVTVTTGIPGPTAHSVALLTSTNPDVGGWPFVGCYSDTTVRVLSGNQLPSLGPMSNEKCVSFCSASGFKYAGTEYGSQCFCGDSLAGSTKLPDSACDIPCADAPSETCGGHWSLSVYSARNGTVVPSPKIRRNMVR